VEHAVSIVCTCKKDNNDAHENTSIDGGKDDGSPKQMSKEGKVLSPYKETTKTPTRRKVSLLSESMATAIKLMLATKTRALEIKLLQELLVAQGGKKQWSKNYSHTDSDDGSGTCYTH
jgi:hypothetical protein